VPEPLLKVALVALNAPGYQSLALGYLRAYAEASERLRGKVGFQTLDLSSDLDPWWVAYRVLGLGADVVGFSTLVWNARAVYEACRIIARARPKTVIVLGGPEVGPVAEEVLAANTAVHAVVRGEGEETFAELLRVFVAAKRAWMVEGVTARKGDEIVSAPDRAPIEDLDRIPSPYAAGVLVPSADTAYIETYRGCPHQCGYCFEGKGSTRIRSFSQQRVRADIDTVAKMPGVRCFSFIDPVFNLTPDRLGWLVDMLEPYARAGKQLHTIEVDIERLDDESAAALKRAGVVSVETGPQSVGNEALGICKRGFQPERFAAGVAACKRAGISVECDLIIGLPGDDPYHVIAGLRWIVGLDPGLVQSSTLHVLPGTDLWRRAEELGLVYDPQPAHEVIATPGIGYRDLRRLEVMSNWLRTEYRARLR
jgi:anaerobic magnesium-protoporphyrin IX monomethyl ester cyclase